MPDFHDHDENDEELKSSEPGLIDREARTDLPLQDNHDNISSQIPFQDLRLFAGTQLRKLNDSDKNLRERDGEVYTDIFRRLQIRPDQHHQFFESCARRHRQKNIDLLLRGSDASFNELTRCFLRSYGYLIWESGRGWLIPVEELDDHEEILLYDRETRGLQCEDNRRLYRSMDALWRQMRNLIFDRKINAGRLPGRHPGRPRQLKPRLLPSDKSMPSRITSEAGRKALSPEPYQVAPLSTFQTEGNGSEKMTTVSNELQAFCPSHKLSAQQTENMIFDLTGWLQDIVRDSDPQLFARLWLEHVGRLDELVVTGHLGEKEKDENDTEASIKDASTPQSSGDEASCLEAKDVLSKDVKAYERVVSNLANEPFATSGVPAAETFPISSCINPVLPEYMTVYLSTSFLPDNHHRVCLTPVPRAYAWVDAPVRQDTAQKFFAGLDSRINMSGKQEAIMWIFSFGWNDRCRVIYQTELTQGWEALMTDLKDAAENGVRVWRMKVAVVISRN